MKKAVLSTALLLASLQGVIGTLSAGRAFAAEIDPNAGGLGYFVTTVNTGSSTRLDLYRMGTNGVATQVHQNIFPDSTLNTFSASDYTVNTKTGKIYFLEPPQGGTRRIRVWDIKSESFEGYTTVEGLPAGGSPMFIEYPTALNELVRKTCTSTTGSCTDTDPTKVTLGASESGAVAVIDQEGLSVGGKSIVRREINSNGEEELHIGENSLVTVESNGVQKLYATDATGKKIPINITEGSDLQINGVSVQGQLDQHSTDIQINRTAIQRNTEAIDAVQSNVNELGSGVAGAAALTAALSALPAASSDAPLSCGVGTGGYSSRYAMGVGCAARLSERLSLNAGGSVLFGGANSYGGGTLDTVADRAGFVFKLGSLASSSSPSKLQSKLQEMETQNAKLSAQLEAMQSRMTALEAMAMGHR